MSKEKGRNRGRRRKKAKIYGDEWKGGGEERMEEIFKKVLNFPSPLFSTFAVWMRTY